MRSLLFFLIIAVTSSIQAQKKFTVVIDAGHGGSNKGAISGEIEEKELTLELALKLKAFFDKHGSENIHAVFTRTNDTELPVKNRIELIERIKPDLFISLHFNSQKFLSTNRGFEVYYPADVINEKSVETAQKYDRANRSFIYGSIFKEMFFKANLHTTWKLPFNLFTQKYDLMMFDDTTAPGLLLEIAYLTSPEDRACIENPDFVADIAWYIYDSVVKITEKSRRGK
ncbi:MAG TPA: N-acetylmuramoyl-L-alanine amidase [bacterium]|nr:N-acetylmuramoyl-L-alanine amidase [bacterium]